MKTKNSIQTPQLLAVLFIAALCLEPAVLAKKGGGGGGGKPGGGDPPPEEDPVRPALVVPDPDEPIWAQAGRDAANSSSSPFLGPVNAPVLKWVSTELYGVESQPVVDADGNLTIARQWDLIQLDRNGQVLWRTSLEGRTLDTALPALSPNGTIYMAGHGGGQTGKVFAVDPSQGTTDSYGILTGAIAWSFEVATIGAQPASPRFVPDEFGGILYIGFTTGELFALDANPLASDRVLWSLDIGFEGLDLTTGSIAVDFLPDGDGGARTVLYTVGDEGRSLYALDGASGNVEWIASFDQSISRARNPVVGKDSTIYLVTEEDARVHAFAPDGTLKWSAQIRQKNAVKGKSSRLGRLALDEFADAVTGEMRTTVYVGVERGIQALNADGSLKWKWEEASSQVKNPAVAADGIVYFRTAGSASGPDNLFAVSPGGVLIWSTNIPGGPATPVIDTRFDSAGSILESILYLGNPGGDLSAVGEFGP